MIRIIIAPEKGDTQEFNSIEDFRSWVRMEHAKLNVILQSVSDAATVPETKTLLQSFSELDRAVSKASSANDDYAIVEAPKSIFLAGSDALTAMLDIAHAIGIVAFRGAVFAAGVPVGNLDWTRTETLAGMMAYKQRIENLQGEYKNTVSTAVKAQIFEIQDQIDTMRGNLSRAKEEVTNLKALSSSASKIVKTSMGDLEKNVTEKSGELESKVFTLRDQVDQIEKDSKLKISLNADKLDDHLKETTERVDAWSNAQMEKIQLEAPVRLWNRRGREHRQAARNLARTSVGVGIAGTIATPLVWYGAFTEARALLADPPSDKAKAVTTAGTKAVVTPTTTTTSTSSTPAVPTVRPTLHFELIFAGAATLFWLTMFFWLMRILVRRYSAEQRLFTDASGRAAMTQTYIGLTAKGRAKKTERPIILGALFQPVTDGAASDDGPPATSMASIVAAIVAGKN